MTGALHELIKCIAYARQTNGDDPDSFSKKVSSEELKSYLKENSKDFINFKVSLLLEDAKNDPVKKAALIREIVSSIAKIQDNIQREICIKCAHSCT